MRALVTGGAGFIGSHLAKALIATGWKVSIIDDLSTGLEKNLLGEARFVRADLRESKTYSMSWTQVPYDAVFHLAAQSSGTASFLDPEGDMRSHVLATFRLLSWAMEHNARQFIYASSSTIYGDQDVLPAAEDAPLKPKSFYAAGKINAENYVNFFHSQGLPTTILRMPNVYGPGQNLMNRMQGMVSIFLAYLLEGEPIVVKGSPDRFRDFIHVDDVVAAWLAVIHNKRCMGRTYNLSFGEKTTVAEVLDALRQAMGSPDHPVMIKEGTPGDQMGVYCDISRLKADTDWAPCIEFAEGIRQTIETEVLNASRKGN